MEDLFDNDPAFKGRKRDSLCHAECSQCNRFDAEHLHGYRENLVKKIGEQRFLLLEVKAHDTKKWSHFELEQLIKYYRALVDKLQKEKGIKI